MTKTMTTTLSRRGWLSRLAMAAAVAPMVGATRAEIVDAEKKDKKKQEREARVRRLVKMEAQFCKDQGGTATIDKKPGGTTVTCSGLASGDYLRKVTSKKGSQCHGLISRTPPPPPPCTLKPLGESCNSPEECCGGGCNGQCCLPDGAACVSEGDCCGGVCNESVCSSLV